MASYYRRFIPNFAIDAAPLNHLLRGDVNPKDKRKTLNWGEQQAKAVQTLKAALSSPPLLALPDFGKPFRLVTDGCAVGLAGSLSQAGPDGKEIPIAYASRATTKAEEKWSTTDLEAMAAVWAMETFRPFLLGRPFTLETDHQALVTVLNATANGKHVRWATRAMEYDFKIVHRKGKDNPVADALSRAPLPRENAPATSTTATSNPAPRRVLPGTSTWARFCPDKDGFS